MNYREFKEEVLERIELIYPSKEIDVFEVVKNNGVRLDGMMIIEQEEGAAPTIYLNDYYRMYETGKPLDDVVHEIIQVYEACRYEEPLDIDAFKDFEAMKDCIAWKLINYEKNEELLQEVPHIMYYDLAIVFFCLLKHERLGCSTILIHEPHLDIWGIEIGDLEREARKNSIELLGFEIRSIYDTIKELFEENFGELDEKHARHGKKDLPGSDIPMFVLTNEMQMYGASCILYDEILEVCHKRLGGDFYILPSSIHELILIPIVKTKSGQNMQHMVKEINDVHVDEEEILSDHIYIYNGARKKVLPVFYNLMEE